MVPTKLVAGIYEELPAPGIATPPTYELLLLLYHWYDGDPLPLAYVTDKAETVPSKQTVCVAIG